MASTSSLYSIILAAGKGRRMRSRDKHKVCFEIAGVPAIVRAIESYNRLGATLNVVVVGDLAGQVVETVGRCFSNVIFAYQPEARGTGDAARCGLQALASADDHARILVVAGDKLIESATLARLLDHFERGAADLCFLVSPVAIANESAGRVLFRPDGSPLAIAEVSDIRVRSCRAELHRVLTAAADGQDVLQVAEQVVTRHLGEAAWAKVLGCPVQNGALDKLLTRDGLLGRLGTLPRTFQFGADGIAAHDALGARFCNESVYLVRRQALAFGLNFMSTDNVQGEEYLTDAISGILAVSGQDGPRFRGSCLQTEKPGEVMSFNNPEELLAIEDRFQGEHKRTLEQVKERLGHERYRTVQQWLTLFPEGDEPVPNTDEVLRTYYGDDPALLAQRRRAYRQTLLRFQEAFGGDRPVVVVRSPGRINIMGRHIDWQGGCCNLMAVDQEAILVAASRTDDRVEIRNVQRDAFRDESICLSQLVSQLHWDDWLSCINSQEQQRRLRQANGDWRLYVEAAMLRLQMEFRQQMLAGMDLVVHSNIPVAAGMSSSSALVVATAEAALALNGLNVVPRQFVNFCGEGEWFVGTRGGSADHAAMKFGSKGMVTHVKFHDFEVLERVPFSGRHRLVVCNSFVQAKKAATAKTVFNARVASYRLGVALVRQRFPQYAPFVHFIRDINPETLRVAPAKIYEILLELPESLSQEQARSLFAGDAQTWSQLEPYLTGPGAPADYPVRGVVLFGIGECMRAREAVVCLRNQDMAGLGRLMNISHQGERCFKVAEDLTPEPVSATVSDEFLRGLIEDLQTNEAARLERAQLQRQPGSYRCSTLEIDTLVDIALGTPGVLGAQLAGAGLGGCAMILAELEAVPVLQERLLRNFYDRRGLPSGIYVCTPAAGSRVVAIEA